MRKLSFLFALGLLATGLACATPTVIKGSVTVSHGWVKRPDGTKVNIAGMTFPVTATRISATEISARPKPNAARTLPPSIKRLLTKPAGRFGGAVLGPEADVQVYDSNFSTYGFVEANPSSLDDVVISPTGVNKPWSQLWFGFNYGFSSFSNFLMRWRIWDSNADNPAGQNDFNNEIADFGVIWNIPLPAGAWYVGVGVSQAQVVAPDTTVYIAQQFRTPQPNGEGAFVYGIDTIFNFTTNPPAIGSSLDQFWYDWDPTADGKYENTEIDIIEGGTRADHAFDIYVNSSALVDTVNAGSVAPEMSSFTAGDHNSLFFVADGDELKMKPAWSGAREDPIASFIATSSNSPTATPTSLKVDGMFSSQEDNISMKLELFHYGTNQWVNVGTWILGPTPTPVTATYGGLLSLNGFLPSTTPRRFKARVSYKNLHPSVPRTWDMNCDQLKWTITR